MALQIRAADTSASAEIELPAPDIDAAYHVDGFMQPSLSVLGVHKASILSPAPWLTVLMSQMLQGLGFRV